MAYSMTAFGRAESNALVWEVRSINHRFLDVSLRLPDDLRDLELPLRERVRKVLNRGKVDATAHWSPAVDDVGFDIDRVVLDALQRTTSNIEQSFNDLTPASALDVLRWPGVVKKPDRDLDVLKQDALGAFRRALDELVAARALEGNRLADILIEKLDAISALTQTVRTIADQQDTVIRERIQTRISDRLGELATQTDPARIEQEVALLVSKADVAEELDRLLVHVEAARASLEGTAPCGRRLDFLMQEFNREANTLASKSILPEVSASAVEMKVLIEQMREQVQNLE